MIEIAVACDKCQHISFASKEELESSFESHTDEALAEFIDEIKEHFSEDYSPPETNEISLISENLQEELKLQICSRLCDQLSVEQLENIANMFLK